MSSITCAIFRKLLTFLKILKFTFFITYKSQGDVCFELILVIKRAWVPSFFYKFVSQIELYIKYCFNRETYIYLNLPSVKRGMVPNVLKRHATPDQNVRPFYQLFDINPFRGFECFGWLVPPTERHTRRRWVGHYLFFLVFLA